MSKFLPGLLAAVAIIAGCSRADRTAEFTPPPESRGESAPAVAPSTVTAPAPRPPQVTMDAIADTVITAKVKAEILNDPGMAGADVSVNTDNGVVSLAGTVKNPEQTAIASAHAQRQDGVMRVDNHLAFNAH